MSTRTSHYCGDYTALTTTKWGAKIYVDTRDTSLAPHIMVQGDWEPWVTDAMAQVLKNNKGCTFIDVGANVGWYTLLACGLGAGHVYAFEPNPRMVELLKKTIAVNGFRDRVTLTEAACGAETGHGYLHGTTTEAGGAHIVDPQPGDGPAHAKKIVRLDDIVLPAGMVWAKPMAPIIKIDVEGFEPQVLAGAEKLLYLRPILFLEHARDDLHRLQYAALIDRGYVLQEILHTSHLGAPLTLDEVMAVGAAETVLCTPKGT
jgi:FkbM family methyltransferase